MNTKRIKWPKVTFVFPSLNGGKGVADCLESVKKQVYPKNRIEVIVMDNGSTDDSVKIAKKYTQKVFISHKPGYQPRADGMRKATGEYVYMILEQDMELKSKYFIQEMVKPLLEDKTLAGSFTREYPRKDQPWVTRFISYHPVQCDPLFEYITPSIESTIVKKKKNYSLCKYIPGRIPPTTHMLFRVAFLKKTPVWKQKNDFDHDTILGLIESGFDKFAYVPSAGIYHHHAKNLKQLITKRMRNLNNHYFPYQDTLKYKWVETNNRKNVFKMIAWIIYANLFFPASIRGFYRAIKYKDAVLLMEPLITIMITDVVLWKFLTNDVGRKIINNSIKTLLSR
jgi:glycosyltransferase involved in cell wall biosynthesis